MKKIVVLLSLSLILLTPAFAQKKNLSKKAPEKREVSRQDPKEVARLDVLKKEGEKSPEELRVDYDKKMKRKYEIFRKELRLDDNEMNDFWARYTNYSESMFKIDNEYKIFKDAVYKSQFGDNSKDYDELKLDSKNAESILRSSIEVERKKNETKREFIEELLKSYRPVVVLKYTVLEDRMEGRNKKRDNPSDRATMREMRPDQPAMRDALPDQPAMKKK